MSRNLNNQEPVGLLPRLSLMRSRASTVDSSLHLPAPAGSPAAAPGRSDLGTLKRLFPYLWEYKWRVVAALAFMVGAKLANVGVPLLLKSLVDAMSFKPGDMQAVLVVPAALLLAYGLLRLSTTEPTKTEKK